MRVKMLESMPVTVDGVATIDAEAGEEYLMGDGVAADLIDAGLAEACEDATAEQPRRRRGGEKTDPAKLAAEEAAAKEAADAEEAAKLAAEEEAARLAAEEAAATQASEAKDAGAAAELENKATAPKPKRKQAAKAK